MARNYAERRLHLSVARLLEWTARRDVLWFHVPNEGVRTGPAGALLKALGMRRGIPDIIVLADKRCIGLELKASAGRLSPEQEEMAERWTVAGGLWHVANSYQAAFDFLDMAGVLRTVKDARVLPRQAEAA